jgi:hypothetical protein
MKNVALVMVFAFQAKWGVGPKIRFFSKLKKRMQFNAIRCPHSYQKKKGFKSLLLRNSSIFV